MGDRVPRNLPEVYAREAIFLHEEPERELKLQAIRIGELGIAAIPDEVFALTGLKIKARSPLPLTMNIELANGSEGYIPPPEQHVLGGYTTWPARTAALEVQAEPKIVATVLGLLEKVAGRARRAVVPKPAPYTEHVLAARPTGLLAARGDGGRRRPAMPPATSTMPVTRTASPSTCRVRICPGSMIDHRINRAPHLAGGRIAASLAIPVESYSVELWFWNGLPSDARPVTGYLVRAIRGRRGGRRRSALGGSSGTAPPGRLFVSQGPREPVIAGKTEIRPRTWHHVVLVRNGRRRGRLS